jgi:hypothetical protein
MDIQVLKKSFLGTSLVLCLFCVNNARAQETTCTETEAIAAETVSSGLKSWTSIYDSFKRFGHCDDGAVAEGYSDSVVRTLASCWNQLGTLQKLASSDDKFHEFVLRHIDATTDERDIKKIITNATKRCPAKAKTICAEIEKQSRAALRDVGGQR